MAFGGLNYGGPKGRAMQWCSHDNIHVTVDSIYATIDDFYVKIDNDHSTTTMWR